MAGANSSRVFRGLAAALCFGLSLLLAGAPAYAQTRVNAITVEGNQRIPASTIISLADLERGAVVSDAEINDAVQRIFNSGLFVSVDPLQVAGGIRFVVVERPTINRINIEGNRRLDDEDLLGILTSQPRRVYSPTVAEADASRLADVYAAEARLAATVTPKIIRRSDNRVDLIFEVAEGRNVENERVSFVGNRAYSDRRLRRAIGTRQAGFLRALIRDDIYSPERIQSDREDLREFYNARGYVDFQVLDVTTEFSRERDASFITFHVREGQQYSVGEISVTSEFSETDIEEYRRAIRLRSGVTWNPRRIEEQIERLERLALQQGLDFLRAEPRITRNNRTLTLDVEFALVRGPRVFVERIDIKGNATTLDRVVRRQFDTVEGDPFNPREIRDAEERIRALDYFVDPPDVQTREGSSQDQVVVSVDVEEKLTGSLDVRASYNTDTGVGLILGFSERNFLGRGQRFSASIDTGTEFSNSFISFREPAFLGRDLTFGLTARHLTTDFNSAAFETRVNSFRPSLGFPLSENGRLSTYYEIAREDILNVSPDASPIVLAETGDLWRSSVGYEYTLDLLRGGLNPNRGIRFTFGQEIAGLGGDTEFVKTTGTVVAQRDIMNEEVTLRAIFEGGIVSALGGGGTRVTDRFFLSSDQLRGFDFRGVGPRDTGAVISDVLGGNQFISARFEADFPLGLPEETGITGGAFIDFGALWGLDDTAGAAVVDDGFELRSSIGFSLFWTSFLGPLRINIAKPLQKNPLDEERTFDITISAQF